MQTAHSKFRFSGGECNRIHIYRPCQRWTDIRTCHIWPVYCKASCFMDGHCFLGKYIEAQHSFSRSLGLIGCKDDAIHGKHRAPASLSPLPRARRKCQHCRSQPHYSNLPTPAQQPLHQTNISLGHSGTPSQHLDLYLTLSHFSVRQRLFV
jgi:hypothetical protein